MRYPIIVVLVVGGIFLLAWLVSGRRIPVLVHAGAVFAALATLAFLLWLRSGGKVIEPEAWGAVILVPVLVYVTFAFAHAMHSAEKGKSTVSDEVLPSPRPQPPDPWRPSGLSDPLSPKEKAQAAMVQIWRVHWELPDKDWDAYCLSVDAEQQLFQTVDNDSLIRSWGHVHRHDTQTLLAWYEERMQWHDRFDREKVHQTAREILRRVDAGIHEPVVIFS